MPDLKQLSKNRLFILGALLVAALGIWIFYKAQPAFAKTPPAPPAVSVDVQTIHFQNVRVWSQFSGRMQAVDYAEIRPQVSGRIVDVRIKDGHNAKAGDVLFVIDPRPFEAAVAKAEANLASAKTNANFNNTDLKRASQMIKTEAIARRLYDERANAARVSSAALRAAEAELQQAKLDLDHAYVKAPISGRISRAEITVGNLVQAGPNAPLLTSIVSNNGIYADFEVDEQTYLKSIRNRAGTQTEEQAIPVKLTLPGDDTHVFDGTIHSFDNRIDTGSGTIRARARFDNTDGRLVPGMFASVKMANSGDDTVLLVPERAIGNDQNKKFVYVVDDKNKVVYRDITLGDQVDGNRIVLTGLLPGERVVVDGVQHVKPDALVEPKEISTTPEAGAPKPATPQADKTATK
jgi:multidrug efflux system membrane fusion protein